MFQLEKEVEVWSRAVQGHGLQRSETIAELEDHLYCVIDRLQEEGLSAEEAFRTATHQLGEAEALAAEFEKNRDLWAVFCAGTEEPVESQPSLRRFNMDNKQSPRKLLLGTLAYTLLFAVVMAVLMITIGGTDQFEAISTLIFFLWLVPLPLISSKYATNKNELACLWRKVTRFIRREEHPEEA